MSVLIISRTSVTMMTTTTTIIITKPFSYSIVLELLATFVYRVWMGA